MTSSWVWGTSEWLKTHQNRPEINTATLQNMVRAICFYQSPFVKLLCQWICQCYSMINYKTALLKLRTYIQCEHITLLRASPWSTLKPQLLSKALKTQTHSDIWTKQQPDPPFNGSFETAMFIGEFLVLKLLTLSVLLLWHVNSTLKISVTSL